MHVFPPKRKLELSDIVAIRFDAVLSELKIISKTGETAKAIVEQFHHVKGKNEIVIIHNGVQISIPFSLISPSSLKKNQG